MDREPLPLDQALAKVRELAAAWPGFVGDPPCGCCQVRPRRPDLAYCWVCWQAGCDGHGRCRVQDDLKGV